MTRSDCQRCGVRGEGYAHGHDPCWGELEIISACCGHGREKNHINLRDKHGRYYRATIHTVTDARHVPIENFFGDGFS